MRKKREAPTLREWSRFISLESEGCKSDPYNTVRISEQIRLRGDAPSTAECVDVIIATINVILFQYHLCGPKGMRRLPYFTFLSMSLE